MFVTSLSVLPSRPIQLTLIKGRKVRSLPQSGAPEHPSLGKGPALLKNIRPIWKGLPGTKTSCYKIKVLYHSKPVPTSVSTGRRRRARRLRRPGGVDLFGEANASELPSTKKKSVSALAAVLLASSNKGQFWK